jgi:hypothetical protein
MFINNVCIKISVFLRILVDDFSLTRLRRLWFLCISSRRKHVSTQTFVQPKSDARTNADIELGLNFYNAICDLTALQVTQPMTPITNGETCKGFTFQSVIKAQAFPSFYKPKSYSLVNCTMKAWYPF